MEYMTRYLDDELEQWMNVIGAVLIIINKIKINYKVHY